MRKLTTQAGGVSLGRGLAALASLATAMVLSRILSENDYGTYRQVWLIFFTLAPILELGIPPSVSFFLPQLPSSKVKSYLIQNSLVLLVSGSFLGLAFLLLGGPVEQLFKSPDLADLLCVFALFPALTIPFNMTENTLVALGRAGTAGMVSSVAALVQNGVILGSVLLGGSLSQTFLLLSLWALLRWGIAFTSLLYLSRALRITWDWRALRSQVGFALPMGAAAATGLLTRQLDKLIVSSGFSTEQFAVYANGSYEIPLISILTLSVTAVLVPAIVRAQAQGDVTEIRRLWHGAARRMAWLFFPAFSFLFIAAQPLMVFLFSEKYAASAAPFRVFLFLLPLRIAFYGAFLRALGKTRPILITSLGAMVISLVLALVLIRIEPLGFLAPAIAAVIASYWAAWYSIRVALRTLNWRWREYFPWRALAA
ncbi:MAG: oligosaccharide flippase family protein, partial [Candidatus Eisenbacteria sp.]|nr:oligosaccharide flippase family protein [Candidatus Eisenbacteria bacterium]